MQLYPTDTTDEEWGILKPLIPAPKSGGRPAFHPRRDIVDAIFYVKRGGISWRMLPIDFPPWKTVYDYFRIWQKSGLWADINDLLRSQVRQAAGRNEYPSAGSVDSRSVKTSQKGGSEDMMGAKKSTVASNISRSTP